MISRATSEIGIGGLAADIAGIDAD